MCALRFLWGFGSILHPHSNMLINLTLYILSISLSLSLSVSLSVSLSLSLSLSLCVCMGCRKKPSLSSKGSAVVAKIQAGALTACEGERQREVEGGGRERVKQ